LASVEAYLSCGASKKTITGADGKFSFTNLISGNHIITPSKMWNSFSPWNYEVSQTKKDLNFTSSLTNSFHQGKNDAFF